MKGVFVVRDNSRQLAAALRKLAAQQVLVGIPAKTAGRQPEPGEPADINNATVGYLMENGSPAANIPARPHLVPGIASIKAKVIATYRTAGRKALDGNLAAPEVAHNMVGLMAQTAVQAKITDGPFVPLSPRTLQQRRRHGRTGEKPLINTGQYRRAITYVVRKK